MTSAFLEELRLRLRKATFNAQQLSNLLWSLCIAEVDLLTQSWPTICVTTHCAPRHKNPAAQSSAFTLFPMHSPLRQGVRFRWKRVIFEEQGTMAKKVNVTCKRWDLAWWREVHTAL